VRDDEREEQTTMFFIYNRTGVTTDQSMKFIGKRTHNISAIPIEGACLKRGTPIFVDRHSTALQRTKEENTHQQKVNKKKEKMKEETKRKKDNMKAKKMLKNKQSACVLFRVEKEKEQKTLKKQ
jgi:hypothetical protein